MQSSDALASLKGLFEFIQWIDYCYSSDYQECAFDESLIPTEKISVDIRKIKGQESLLDEKEAEIVIQKALDETQLLFDSLMQKYFG